MGCTSAVEEKISRQRPALGDVARLVARRGRHLWHSQVASRLGLGGVDRYVTTAPNAQAVVDLFDGDWSSAMPEGSGLVSRPGHANLFDDPRIHWAREMLGGFEGNSVVELGPLEGAHSYMVQGFGAASITAIEANTRAYLRCLCMKEVFALDRVNFKLGDFVPYLEQEPDRVDAIIACGVLYHMREPLHLLELIAAHTDRLFLWTHYYDPQVIQGRPDLRDRFDEPRALAHSGRTYSGAPFSYEDALIWSGFSGGTASGSFWLTRSSIEDALKTFGFVNQVTNFDEPDHPNGPALAMCAWR